ncbi:MAG: class I SAM-dependent methyltransferase [Armatimonadota bacterium]|nr:class I SAM-dependent methyltransferase [Armatimonadota bacterium]
MKGSCIQVSQLGLAYLPAKFADFCASGTVKRINAAPGERSQAERFLKQGGTLVVVGEWDTVRDFAAGLLSRERELVPNASDARERKLLSRSLRARIMTTLQCTPLGRIFEPREIAGFLGEESLPDDMPTLIPVTEAERLLGIPYSRVFVEAAGAELAVHPDVLAPKSQETTSLIRDAITLCEPDMPQEPEVLDMGCGSGALSVVAWQVLAHKNPRVTATDILNEAVATTRFNWRRLAEQGKVGPMENLSTTCGNLFEPLGNAVFDLIIFNAPWVTAPAHTRADAAIMDEDQRTVAEFLNSCASHLKPSGRVILAYASNAGQDAVSRLEQFIGNAGLRIIHVLKTRIHTRRAKRRWQNVYAYILRPDTRG